MVPTPIGNMGDITLRAIDILQSADLILAEDTRKSGKLLKHLSIRTRMKSFHQHNEHAALKNVIQMLQDGKQVALITDGGTPGISDPGFLLVRDCISNDIAVECLPGATALIPALVLSGFPSERFRFEGFLPVKKGRVNRLKQLSEEDRTIVLYESPHRLTKTLGDLLLHLGEDREAAVCRELTKLHEQVARGTLSELKEQFQESVPKGEIVIVVNRPA